MRYLPFFVSDLYCTALYVWKNWCWCFKPAVISVIRNVGLFLIPQCPLCCTQSCCLWGEMWPRQRGPAPGMGCGSSQTDRPAILTACSWYTLYSLQPRSAHGSLQQRNTIDGTAAAAFE